MAVQIPPGFALAAWEMRFPGDPDPWYCTLGVGIDLGATTGAAIADGLFGAWHDNIIPTQNTNLTLQGVTLKIGSDGAPTMAYSTVAAEPGLLAQNILPQNCALLVDKLTASGGRRSRGRFYVPGCLEEGYVDNIGNVHSTMLTSLTTAWNEFYDAVHAAVGVDEGPVVLHSPSAPGTVNPTPPGDPTEITSFRVQSVISTQRKRLR